MFQTAKAGAALDDTYESNESISLELIWLVCFKLMRSYKHRIQCYSVLIQKMCEISLIKLI